NAQLEEGSWPNRNYPARWNNYQQAFHQDLLRYRQEVSNVNRRMKELDLEMQRANESAIQDAAAKGKSAKSANRADLAEEIPRLKGQAVDAFTSAKEALVKVDESSGPARLQAYRKALKDLTSSGEDTSKLVPIAAFRSQFEAFCGKDFFATP